MNDTMANVPSDAIAVVGMSARVPGASDVDGFWSNLVRGVESISRFSDDELLASGIPRDVIRRPNYVNARGVLEQADCFDASFFGYSADEACVLDPQQRVLLECAWHALEHAGYDPETYEGRIGLYAGANVNTYWLHHRMGDRLADPLRWYQVRLANDKDFLATRVSYKLNLVGPSVAVQTACSTSLVAVSLACQTLLDCQCDLAIAGGVSIGFPQKSGYLFHEGGIASPDGHCRAYAAQARGCVSGEGVGLVVLKRLDDALLARDTIHGVIKGWAVNNDGSAKVGYTAPSIAGQTTVIQEALAVADVEPATIGYVEGHGTGTSIGDPIEVSALTQAFRAGTDQTQFCALGSVKSNIGHLDAAAGVAGLIKAVLAVKHGVIPPSLHFDAPNPKLNLESSPFYVPAAATPWPSQRRPRRAGVSAFGIGGTNAHVVLEEPPAPAAVDPSRPVHLVAISAKSRSALGTAAKQLADYLRRDPAVPIADVAYTLHVGRRSMPYRRAVACRDVEGAIAGLTRESAGEAVNAGPSVFFMFPGQGAQVRRMGTELYRTEPTYRRHLDACADLLASACDFDLLSWLDGTGPFASDTQEWLRTAWVQPGLFAVEYALARMWNEWGIAPAGMIGHSVGEYVAACLAGVFEIRDALTLVAQRGALMQGMQPGAMLAAQISEQQARELAVDDLFVAAVNAPTSCTLSGPLEAIEAAERLLRGKGTRCTRLHTSHAFHSGMMAAVVPPFMQALEGTPLSRPATPFISNVSGTWITDEQATSPSYWGRHLLDTVRFADGLRELLKGEAGVYLEAGPGRTLASLLRRQAEATERHVTLGSLSEPDDRGDEHRLVVETLGACWAAGVPIDWTAFHADERRNRIPLPGYPFERRQFVLERATAQSATAEVPLRDPAPTAQPSRWLYAPIWRQTPPVPPTFLETSPSSGHRWVILAGDDEIGRGLTARLRARGDQIVIVEQGPRFERLEGSRYAVDIASEKSFEELIAALGAEHQSPERIVHLWGLERSGPPDADALETAHRRGIGSLLLFTKAMVKAGWRQPLRISVVTNDMQPVLGPARHPEQAPVLGFCRVVPREHPNVACHAVDISLGEPSPHTIERLVDEVTASEADLCVAYRGGRRWTLGYQPARSPESCGLPQLRQGGTYLITGGLGGVGLGLAEYLSREADANLVLVTRSGNLRASADAERKHEILSRLVGGRGQVLMLQADVANRAELEDAIARAEERFGTINGVIHAAGVPGGGLVRTKTLDDVARVFAPKITGTVQLVECLRGKPLDFFVLCSSISAILGEVGQLDYCAANAFLDAFAHSSSVPPGGMTIGLNWDRWSEVGMAANAAAGGGGRDTVVFSTPDRRPAHPLVDGVRRSGDQEVYTTYFSPRRHWILDQHRVAGYSVLPGTAYIELAAAAFGGGHAPQGSLEFRDLYFLRPLRLRHDETIEVQTVIRRTATESTFRVVSINATDGTTTEHAGGTVCERTGALGDVPPLEDRPGPDRELSISEMLPIEDGWVVRGVKRLGPRWQVLRRVSSRETASGLLLRAVLDAPSAAPRETGEYYADPALLDVAMSHPLATMVHANDDSYVALGCRRLVLERPLPAHVVSQVRWPTDQGDKGTLHWDVSLADADGVVCGVIERFTARAVRETVVDGSQSAVMAEREDRIESTAALGANPIGSSGERPQLVGLSVEQGVDVFRRALSLGLPQIIVSMQDLFTRLERPGAVSADASIQGRQEAIPSAVVEKTADRAQVTAAVYDIWREILGVPVEDPGDDFFQLGGDSLLAVRMTARFRDQLGISLGVDVIFDHPTVGELCGLVLAQHRPEQSDEPQWSSAAPMR